MTYPSCVSEANGLSQNGQCNLSSMGLSESEGIEVSMLEYSCTLDIQKFNFYCYHPLNR